ncbi:Molybdenum cofactor sulfurase like protein [Verticillium longisporum]|uniref:Molybdenum cofactor sulfurase like protein n=1 Tax=Verticillium longisporum TaxID=100787 RepID=A0A8I3AU43_VERLO|nr:Molybdenum cofactor sulfurase like protein [Verticillium longisporum]
MAEPSYNALVEGFRDREYPMLKESVYLDHAGTTVYSKSMMDIFVVIGDEKGGASIEGSIYHARRPISRNDLATRSQRLRNLA